MSYILDALKKSEQERGHGTVPGVQTMHSSSLSYRNEKKAYWPYILIVAVILNLLAILYFIIDKDQPPVIVTGNSTQGAGVTEKIQTPETTRNSTQSIATSDPVSDQKSNSRPTVTDTRVTDSEPPAAAADNTMATPPAAETVRPQTAPRNTKATRTAASENIEVIEFFDLPESIKDQLPAIIISAHVYSTNPLQRSIVINNNFMEEGEYVIDDLLLREITTDGAIFDYQNTRFHYGVVSSWQ